MKKLRPKIITHSFTLKAPGIANVFVMDLAITKVNEPVNVFKTKGIWDTGASGTVITKEIFDYFNLQQQGVKSVSTASISNVLKPTYLIDVFLKKDLRIQTVEVTVGNIAAERGIHCLIGMDIIALGDFSITNFEGKSCLSFRIPSLHEVDFVKRYNDEKNTIERHINSGRNFNSPCICLSGKKFKNCHGKNLIEEN